MQMKRHLLTLFFFISSSSSHLAHSLSNTRTLVVWRQIIEEHNTGNHEHTGLVERAPSPIITPSHKHTLISRQRKLWDLAKWVIGFKPNWMVSSQIPRVDSDALTSGAYVNHRCWSSDKCFAEPPRLYTLSYCPLWSKKWAPKTKSTVNRRMHQSSDGTWWYRLVKYGWPIGK